MKKFLKMAALMMLAGVLVVGFASCSNGSDDSSSSSGSKVDVNALGTVTATYTRGSGDSLKFWYFYDGGNAAYGQKKYEAGGAPKGIIKVGTYKVTEGSFTSDSGNVKIEITLSKVMNNSLAWEAATGNEAKETLTGTNGAGSLTDTDNNTWDKQ